MSLPTVVFVGPALLCALSWLGIGSLFPARWLPDDALLAFLLRIGAGAAVLGWAAFLVGLAGVFRPWLFIVVTVVFAVPGAVALRPKLRLLSLPRARAARALLALAATALLLDVVAASVPPTSADALKYHVTVPERWLEIGHIDDPAFRWEAYSPFAVEMLFAQALSFAPGGEAAGAVGALLTVLAAVAVVALARELDAPDSVAGAAAAALYVAQGLMTWEATSEFVEPALAFYVLLVVSLAIRAFRTGELREVGWASFAAGAAAAIKYVALLPAALLLTPLLLVARRGGPRGLAVLALPALALALPWYLRNAIVRGNPFFPLFVGGRGWSEVDEAEVENLSRYGPGGFPLRVLALPVDLLVNGDSFDRGRYVGVLIFVFGALGFVFLRNRLALALTGGLLVYLVAWWTMSAQARFLLVPLGVLAAAGGVSVSRLLRGTRPVRLATTAGLAAVAALWIVPSAALTRQLLPCALGFESRAEMTQRLTGTYDVLQQIAPRVDGALGALGYWFVFHYPEQAVSLGPPGFGADDALPQLLETLQDLDVRYVLTPEGGRVLQYETLRPCLRQLETYQASEVTSRTLGETRPLPLVLHAVRTTRECTP